jgi:hypothetical protein
MNARTPFSLMLELSHPEYQIIIPKIYIKFFNNLFAALVFAHLLDCAKEKNKEGFILKNKEDWLEETDVSFNELKKGIIYLKKKKILEIKKENENTYYRLDDDIFAAGLANFLNKGRRM